MAPVLNRQQQTGNPAVDTVVNPYVKSSLPQLLLLHSDECETCIPVIFPLIKHSILGTFSVQYVSHHLALVLCID